MESEREWEADEKSESVERDSEEDDGRGADAMVDGLGDVLGVKNTSWSDSDSDSSSSPRLERVEASAGSTKRVSTEAGDYSGNEISAGLGRWSCEKKVTHRERMALVASTEAVIVVDSEHLVGIQSEQLRLGGVVRPRFDDGGQIRLGGSTEDRLDQRRLGHRRRRRRGRR